ncbi:MAG TPA: hypothetical protein VGB15_12335 [Longimicrobium sp.]
MIPNQILRVLSILEKHRVSYLLMGGQACVLYGAAEFSRDMDVTVLASPDNVERLGTAVEELNGQVVAIPPFQKRYLDRGHAVHFWCRDPSGDGIRLDVMSKMRGVDEFPQLWARRAIVALEDDTEVPVLALPDLVAAKKTQRDKDWPMVRRLVESNYQAFYDQPDSTRIQFWLRELRTPELLIEAVDRFPAEAQAAVATREAVEAARRGDLDAVRRAFDDEVARERAADRTYWAPLRRELEQLRWSRGDTT